MFDDNPRDADLAACRALLRNGSRSFLAASWLLPRAVREPACALYAFCREADDAVDGADARADAIAQLHARLARIYGRGAPADAVERALAGVVRRHAVPPLLLEALVEGLAWDTQPRPYETLADVQAYAARVAGTVGATMALLMGVRGREPLARACDLGVAMQLTNIARDVGEDARLGRLYLPRDWLREAGIAPEAWLAQPVYTPALGQVIERLLRAADALYARVDAGIAALPPACRPGIEAARRLYAEIGHELRRRGLDSVSRRTVVGTPRKLRLLAAALAHRHVLRPSAPAPALAATAWLVDAAANAPAPAAPVSVRPVRLGERVQHLVELFDRLERRDRAPRVSS